MKYGTLLILVFLTISGCAKDALNKLEHTLSQPTIISPVSEGCLTDTAQPVFTWQEVLNASFYEIVVASDPLFFNVITQSNAIMNTSYNFQQTFEPGIYYWRLLAHGEEPSESSHASSSFIVTYGMAPLSCESFSGIHCGTLSDLVINDSDYNSSAITYEISISTSQNATQSDLTFTVTNPGNISLSEHGFTPQRDQEYFLSIHRMLFSCNAGSIIDMPFQLKQQPQAPINLEASWEGCGPLTYTTYLSYEVPALPDNAAIYISLIGQDNQPLFYETEHTDQDITMLAADNYQWSMWVVNDGCSSAINYGPDVRIDTGRVWEEVTPSGDIFGPREGHEVIVADDDSQIWLIAGGKNDADITFNSVAYTKEDWADVWTSYDGISWKKILDDAPFGGRRWFGSAYFQDKLWIFAGNRKTSNQALNDIWYSIDGIQWFEVPINGERFSARHAPEVVVFDNKLWLIGGETNCVPNNDVWMSSNGISWSKVSEGQFEKRDWHGVTVFHDSMWLSGGVNRDLYGVPNTCYAPVYYADFYSSSDGINWNFEIDLAEESQEPYWTNPAFEPRASHGFITFEDKLWVVGGTSNWGETSVLAESVWYSHDGYTWCYGNQYEGSGFSKRYGAAAFIFKNHFWMIGGKDNNDLHTQDIPDNPYIGAFGHQNDIWVSR